LHPDEDMTPRAKRWVLVIVLASIVLGSALVISGALRRPPAGARDGRVTFNRDIAPLIFAKCAGCHRPEQVGPFKLLSFADAVALDRAGQARYRDQLDPEPGFESMIAETPEGQWLAWVPGKRRLGVEGHPWRLQKGADIVLQLHLQRTGKRESTKSQIALYFA